MRGIEFTDIVTLQGTIRFDPTMVALVLDTFPDVTPPIGPPTVCVHVATSNLPGLNCASFNFSQAADSGIISFSWDDATLAGVSLLDNEILFTLSFELLGDIGVKAHSRPDQEPQVVAAAHVGRASRGVEELEGGLFQRARPQRRGPRQAHDSRPDIGRAGRQNS